MCISIYGVKLWNSLHTDIFSFRSLHCKCLRICTSCMSFQCIRFRTLRPCPHDTFPNRSRSIANGSRPVARVHTGETGTLVPVSRDHLATRDERARTFRDRSRPVDFVVWTLDRALAPARVIFFPINAPGMGRFKLFDLVGYS